MNDIEKKITLPSPLPNDLALAPLHLELTEPKPGAILQWRSSQQWITVMNRCKATMMEHTSLEN